MLHVKKIYLVASPSLIPPLIEIRGIQSEKCYEKKELTCSHVFCTPCLLTWYAQDKPEKKRSNTTCPICRDTISWHIQNSLQALPAYSKILEDNLDKIDKSDSDSSSDSDDSDFVWEGAG